MNPDGKSIGLRQGNAIMFDELSDLPSLGRIHARLESAEREGPFRQCTVCRQSLAEWDWYQISKAFRATECVMEMALCPGCIHDMGKQLSEKSKETVSKFQAPVFASLVERLQEDDIASRDPLEDSCGICGGIAHGRSVSVLCRGADMILPSHSTCSRCEDRIQSSLSENTRGYFRDFFDSTFPGVPANIDERYSIPVF